jgi:hypothetical protein
LAENIAMDSRIPALPRPESHEASAPRVGQHIWERASTIAADRSQTETGRSVRTYVYASGFIGVVFLVIVGASLLFVMHAVATACSSVARFVMHPFQGRPAAHR